MGQQWRVQRPDLGPPTFSHPAGEPVPAMEDNDLVQNPKGQSPAHPFCGRVRLCSSLVTVPGLALCSILAWVSPPRTPIPRPP